VLGALAVGRRNGCEHCDWRDLRRKTCISPVFAGLSASYADVGRSYRWRGVSVNVQKKKISPGHRLSGVSWAVFFDARMPTTAGNDTA
jgi:hypothetical protein